MFYKKITKKHVVILGSIIFIIAISGIVRPLERRDAAVSGLQLGSQLWSGVMIIKGSVYFAPWATLTISPGTRVFFDKRPDIPNTPWTKWADSFIKDHNDPTGREGYQKSHFLIAAKIIAIGTVADPIVFTSNQTQKEYADWDQLVLGKGSRLEYVDLSYAHNGINISGSDVIIRNSIVHNSLWSCIDSFSTGAVIENNEIYHCWHQGIGFKVVGPNIVRGNRIHDAQLSINCEFGANPVIEDTRMEAAPLSQDCPRGVRNVEIERPRDTRGGTYGGTLVYPSE